jgi:hypothetical protein
MDFGPMTTLYFSQGRFASRPCNILYMLQRAHRLAYGLAISAAAGVCIAHVPCAVCIGIKLPAVAQGWAIVYVVAHIVSIGIGKTLAYRLAAARAAAGRCIAHITYAIGIGIKLLRVGSIGAVIKAH